MRTNVLLTNILFLLMISTVSAGCMEYIGGIKGDGNVVKETRQVSNFDKLDVGGAFDIFLTQGDEEKLVVEADQNLMEFIITEVVNGKLKIYTKKEIRNAEELNIYLTSKDLRYMDISGACEVKGENMFRMEELGIDASGASEIDLSLKMDLFKGDFSGATELDLQGYAREVRIDISGAAELNAYDLETEIFRLDVSGASDAKVFATEELHIDASGASSVKYKGTPKVYQDVSGASSVKSY